MQVAELFAADGQPFSFLGASVAVSGDMVVVGAPGIDDGQGNDVPGHAYLYFKSANGWTGLGLV